MGCGSRPNPDLPSPQACAVGLIAVGVATQVVLSQTIIPGATTGSLVPVVIIAVGAFLFLVAFVGCCGACKENYCLMITVSGLWSRCGCLGLLEGRFYGGDSRGWLRKTFVSVPETGGPQQAPLTQTPNLTPTLCSCSLPSSCLLSRWWRWPQP